MFIAKYFLTKKILANRCYFFRFKLEQLSHLLENFDLTYEYPGRIFKKYSNDKGDICSLTIFIDGVRMMFGSFQLNNFFVKVSFKDLNFCVLEFY